MSGKLIPRTELLSWLQNTNPHNRFMSDVYEKLRTGRVLTFEEAVTVSRLYEECHVRVGGDVQKPAEAEASGRGDTQEASPDNPDGAEVQVEQLRSAGSASTGFIRPVDGSLLADDEQVAGDAADETGGGDLDGAQSVDQVNAPKPGRGSILGSYRLQTASGPVIFTAVQGERDIQIFVAQGLNLPGQFSDLEIARSVEFGKPVNFENIKELINA